MKTIYKYFFFTILLLSLLLSFSFADEEHLSPSICDDIVFNLVGPDSVTIWTTHNYALSFSVLWAIVDDYSDIFIPQDIFQQIAISYELLYDWRILQRSNESDFSVLFSQLWSYIVQARISYNKCRYTVSIPVVAYESIFVYIGPYIDEFGMGIIQNMTQNNLFLRPFIIDDWWTNLIPIVRQNWSVFTQSNDIFFSVKNYSLIFDIIRLIQEDKNISLSDKRFFIIDDTQKSILKKFLARFTRHIDDVSLYVISSQEAMNMFLEFSIGKVVYDDSILQNSLLKFSWSNWSYSLSYVIDYLLFQWFPLDMLLLLLWWLFAILFIVFLKQIVWISSFGVYYPLLFAICLYVIWFKTSLFLLFIAFLAKIITILFTRKFTLLATAKIWLQISVYIFLTLFGMVIMSYLWFVWSDFLVFNYPMMLFIYFSILLIASKLWTSSSFFSIKQYISIFLFVVVSLLLYVIINSWFIHRMVLLYPSIILLCIILIILLWRYTWLQLIEIIRFWPLIRYIRNKK